jgi:hypothetical protein
MTASLVVFAVESCKNDYMKCCNIDGTVLEVKCGYASIARLTSNLNYDFNLLKLSVQTVAR